MIKNIINEYFPSEILRLQPHMASTHLSCLRTPQRWTEWRMFSLARPMMSKDTLSKGSQLRHSASSRKYVCRQKCLQVRAEVKSKAKETSIEAKRTLGGETCGWRGWCGWR